MVCPSNAGTEEAEREMDEKAAEPCVFCHVEEERIFYRDDTIVGFWSKFESTPGHALLAPRRHAPRWHSSHNGTGDGLTAAEIRALMIGGVDQAIDAIEKACAAQAWVVPDGYNIGVNSGAAAGQTVMHLHVHVIPRRVGDVEDPRGGVRWVLPQTANYRADDHEVRRAFVDQLGEGWSDARREFLRTVAARLGPAELRELFGLCALAAAKRGPEAFARLPDPPDLEPVFGWGDEAHADGWNVEREYHADIYCGRGDHEVFAAATLPELAQIAAGKGFHRVDPTDLSMRTTRPVTHDEHVAFMAALDPAREIVARRHALAAARNLLASHDRTAGATWADLNDGARARLTEKRAALVLDVDIAAATLAAAEAPNKT